MRAAGGAVVVVGGGVAAQRCVAALRAGGHDGALVLVAREPELPYDRTMLSKDFLTAERAGVRLLKPRATYQELGVELREAAATQLDVTTRRVHLSTGEALRYGTLVVCTGGVPRQPAALSCPGVLLLRELDDALVLREALEGCGELAIAGGGFIGGEVASSAAARGIQVTLVEALAHPLAAALGPEVGARVATLHRKHGVRVLTGRVVRAVSRRGSRFELELDDGDRLGADAVVVGAGMEPATGWLADSPLRLGGGLVTDAACRTNVPNVLAAGDCARWWHPGYGVSMRVEHWDTAARHGAAAARAALGDDSPFAPLPFFWSDQHGVKLQWVGYAPSWDAVEVDDVDPPHCFSVRYLRDGRLLGVLAAGQPRVVAAARKELLHPQLVGGGQAWR